MGTGERIWIGHEDIWSEYRRDPVCMVPQIETHLDDLHPVKILSGRREKRGLEPHNAIIIIEVRILEIHGGISQFQVSRKRLF